MELTLVAGVDDEAPMRLTLPVVFITASDDSNIERLALEVGELRVLHKPFGNDELPAAVRFALPAP